MKIKTGSGNINIVIGFSPDEFDNNKEETKNRILWKSNKKRHSEIRVKGEGGVCCSSSINSSKREYIRVDKWVGYSYILKRSDTKYF
jgi:hypothetical protein